MTVLFFKIFIKICLIFVESNRKNSAFLLQTQVKEIIEIYASKIMVIIRKEKRKRKKSPKLLYLVLFYFFDD